MQCGQFNLSLSISWKSLLSLPSFAIVLHFRCLCPTLLLNLWHSKFRHAQGMQGFSPPTSLLSPPSVKGLLHSLEWHCPLPPSLVCLPLPALSLSLLGMLVSSIWPNDFPGSWKKKTQGQLIAISYYTFCHYFFLKCTELFGELSDL